MRALWIGVAVMSVAGPVVVAAAQPAGQGTRSHTVVLLERENQTRIGDALVERLSGRPLRLIRRWMPEAPGAEGTRVALVALRDAGADAAVWLEEPSDAEPVISAVGGDGQVERFPLRTRYARVPPRVFAVVASYLLDQLGVGGVPPVQVEVEVVRSPAARTPHAPSDAVTGAATEPVPPPEGSAPGAASLASPEAAAVADGAGHGRVGLRSSVITGALLRDGGEALTAGARLAGGWRLADGWTLDAGGSIERVVGAGLPWLAGVGLGVERQPHPSGVGWRLGGGLLVARDSRQGLQGGSEPRVLLGWRLGGQVRWRWDLRPHLGLALEAGAAAGQLDGRWVLTPVGALTLELGRR